MKFLFLLMGVVLSAAAQQANTPVPPAHTGVEHAADSKLHEDVLTLIAVDGTKPRLQSGIPQQVESGKKQMMQACSRCTPAFGDEWARRMLARLQVEDFVQVIVRTYEKYLNDEDVQQLIVLWKAKNESRPTHVSPELQQKLTSIMPSIQSEILGGCVQIGAKLGAEVGQEIEKEHPDYMKPSANQGKR